MKVFVAGIAAETNTFCPRLTSKKDFIDKYVESESKNNDAIRCVAVPLVTFAERAANRGWMYLEGLFVSAPPSGSIIKRDYEELRDTLLNDLSKAMPVDMVILNLHGAMVAQDYDDCEGDILYRIREIVGKDTPIGVLLDPHANLTNDMLKLSDIIVCYKEYPHTDIEESANHLFSLMEDFVDKKTNPCMVAFDCHVINSYPTTLEPMKSYMDRIKQLENKNDVISISIVHGFPWSDVEDVGSKIITITDNQPDKALSLAKKLGIELFELRDKTMPHFYSIDEALKVAVQSDTVPVVLADFADNAGGGAYGDSTFILQHIIKNNINNVALGVLWDPVAVDIATSVGVSNKLPLRIGGKMGLYSGDPVDVVATVTAINQNLIVNFSAGVVGYGKAVSIRVGSIDIVLSSIRQQVYSTECFSKMGIDLTQKSIVVVKSSEHFRASFKTISNNILSVKTNGTLCPDFSSIQYTKVKRKIWPLDKSISLNEDK
jgi:microcystin degradation protein MlrC